MKLLITLFAVACIASAAHSATALGFQVPAVTKRTETVGWPHKPSLPEMRAVLNAVMRDANAAAGPDAYVDRVKCSFGPTMGKRVRCALRLTHETNTHIITRWQYTNLKFFEDGSALVSYPKF